MAATLGKLNPFRYRGYVYDEETGLYYLRSRYYNPEWGRFINADTLLGKVGALGSHNLFAYCGNEPIMLRDGSGKTGVTWEDLNGSLGALGGFTGLGGIFGGPIGFISGATLWLALKYAGRLTNSMTEALENIRDDKDNEPKYYLAVAFYNDSPTEIGKPLSFMQMVGLIKVLKDPYADIVSYADAHGYVRPYGAENISAVGILTEYKHDALALATAVVIDEVNIDVFEERDGQKLGHYNIRKEPLKDLHFWCRQE